MKAVRFTTIALMNLAMAACFGQPTFLYPKIIAWGKVVSDFIPAGWEMIDSAVKKYDYQNFKYQSYKNYAFVLQYIDSVVIEIRNTNRIEKIKTRPRILIILLQDKKSGVYKLIEQNNKFIIPWDPDSGKDPFTSITFENGVLHIGFSFSYGPAAHDELDYLFRYNGVQFVLIGYNRMYHNSATREIGESSYNFLTKKYWTSYGPDDAELPVKEVWHNIKYKNLRPLSEFREPFTWKLDKDQSL